MPSSWQQKDFYFEPAKRAQHRQCINFPQHANFFGKSEISVDTLVQSVDKNSNTDLVKVVYQYISLKFRLYLL